MTVPVRIHCEAMLFDLDGVLVDSDGCVHRILRRWCGRHGLDPAVVIAAARGRRPMDTVAAVAPHLDAAAEVDWLLACESRETEGVVPVRGAHELVAGLPRQSWAVVTSGQRAVAELRIRHVGLPHPPVLICADDVARGKPDPEPYLAAAQRLGVSPSECIVVEDAVAGVAAARSAGMRCVGIVGSGQAGALDDADWTVPSVQWLDVRSGPHGLEVALRP